MIDEHLQEEAALYASGAMSRKEREEFELLLHCNTDLQKLVDDLHEAVATTLLAEPAAEARPSPELKARIFAQLEGRGQHTQQEAVVMTGPDGLVEWVSPAFSKLCGFSLDELRGKNLGPLLQGRLTDPAAAQRMHDAVHAARPCSETMINYRKDGSPYRVTIDITPILKRDGSLRCFVAREREAEE
ncbi:MAG TPA: PAS domain-containing protein [Chthoniobacteraceae bacterium]|nr:PAS domain-containing protein [Chthoniobacteraceae bacterium]